MNPKNIRHNKPTSNKYCYMAPSKVEGKGLFARIDIPHDIDFVEYEGTRVTRTEGENLAAEGNNYIFTLDRRECIDGSVFWNLARYANHSCSPNARSVKINGKIYLRSIRAIIKGEEITYNYGYALKNYSKNPCNCGSRECAGYIVNESSAEKLKRELIDP